MANYTCPDCKIELTPIKFFGRGWENPISGQAVDVDLIFYTDPEAERGLLSGMYKPQGVVKSYFCQSCDRIFLFALQDKWLFHSLLCKISTRPPLRQSGPAYLALLHRPWVRCLSFISSRCY